MFNMVTRKHIRWVWLAALLIAAASAVPAEAARLTATIDLSAQRMDVSVGGRLLHSWPVSSGRKGYATPTGSYRPTRMHRRYYSRKYDNAPMPHAIFFRGGYAIHGTGETGKLGRPASHGCVRLHPANARALYNLIKQHGRGNTSIRVRR